MFECREPKLLILDPNLVVDIYVKYFKYFGDNTLHDMIDYKADPLASHNPAIENLQYWKERRAEIAPAYTTLKVKTAYPIIENACEQLTKFVNDQIDAGRPEILSKDV